MVRNKSMLLCTASYEATGYAPGYAGLPGFNACAWLSTFLPKGPV